jgi:hypothetical protein
VGPKSNFKKRPRGSQVHASSLGLTIMRTPSTIMLIFLTTTLATTSRAQPGNILGDNYGIMVPEKGSKRAQPEPWLAPKYKSPRRTQKHARVPKSKTLNPPGATVPSSVYVPQTGRTFQNLPTLPGSGPGGAETFQDRAMRCTHQAGAYGQVGGNRGTYMGACL